MVSFDADRLGSPDILVRKSLGFIIFRAFDAFILVKHERREECTAGPCGTPKLFDTYCLTTKRFGPFDFFKGSLNRRLLLGPITYWARECKSHPLILWLNSYFLKVVQARRAWQTFWYFHQFGTGRNLVSSNGMMLLMILKIEISSV